MFSNFILCGTCVRIREIAHACFLLPGEMANLLPQPTFACLTNQSLRQSTESREISDVPRTPPLNLQKRRTDINYPPVFDNNSKEFTSIISEEPLKYLNTSLGT